jgi:hypothetical protein
MIKVLTLVLGVLALLALAPSTALAAGSSTRFEASLSGTTTSMKGTARYEEVSLTGGTQRRLTVEVQNAKPNTTYTVIAGGKTIGPVTTNSLGRGQLELKTLTDDAAHAVASLPKLGSGSVVKVGPIQGSMVRR